jgi:hypothetical protein
MAKLIKISEERVAFRCPGCRGPQHIPVKGPNAWGFNGDMDRPTFTPSILTRKGDNYICHSFVTDGRIRFLSDCTHALAGQTVDLPEVLNQQNLWE